MTELRTTSATTEVVPEAILTFLKSNEPEQPSTAPPVESNGVAVAQIARWRERERQKRETLFSAWFIAKRNPISGDDGSSLAVPMNETCIGSKQGRRMFSRWFTERRRARKSAPPTVVEAKIESSQSFGRELELRRNASHEACMREELWRGLLEMSPDEAGCVLGLPFVGKRRGGINVWMSRKEYQLDTMHRYFLQHRTQLALCFLVQARRSGWRRFRGEDTGFFTVTVEGWVRAIDNTYRILSLQPKEKSGLITDHEAIERIEGSPEGVLVGSVKFEEDRRNGRKLRAYATPGSPNIYLRYSTNDQEPESFWAVLSREVLEILAPWTVQPKLIEKP